MRRIGQPRRPFGLRARIWVTVLAALTVVLIALTVGFNVLLGARLESEANTVASARATAELDGLRVTATGIHLSETPDAGAADTPTWIFQGSRALEQPNAGEVVQRAAAGLVRTRGFRDVPGADTRLYAVRVIHGGRRIGTVVAAVSTAPYEQIRQVALLASAGLAALVLIAVALGTRWLIARALAPVDEMTHQAAEWSEHDLARRFSLGPPHDEFTTLAATLDGLMDRVATSLRHEQMLTAELSHELRTPLSAISAEAQYALRHGPDDPVTRHGFSQILQSARQMTRILDTLIAAARAQSNSSHPTTNAVSAARAAIDACANLAAARDLDLELIEPSHPVLAGVDGGLLERVLAPLLENACRHAARRVQLDVGEVDVSVEIAVHDDGLGVQADDRDHIFVPGYRRTVNGSGGEHAGAGLGLALSRRLARGVGGDVTLATSTGGARFIVTLPHA
jgi:signal transduction histidine kinase